MRVTMTLGYFFSMFFFFNDTATTEIYTLSLHDALPISRREAARLLGLEHVPIIRLEHLTEAQIRAYIIRSEEHTSELQSHVNLVCRLLLEKKKNGSTTRSCSRCRTTSGNNT